MRLVGLPLLLAVWLFGASANASDGDVLRQFGILGRSALDCSAPASSSNPQVIFAVSAQGQATWTLAMATPGLDGTWVIRNLTLITPDQLQYRQVEGQAELAITLRKAGGRFRSWRSESTNGEVRIADGKHTSNGSPTLLFTLCGR